MDLTAHFSLEEMTHSQTAVRLGLVNHPTKTTIVAMRTLCEKVLEPLRTKLGKPIKISSGFRSPAVNRAVGGAPNSQHIRGEAADIMVAGMTVQELFDFIAKSGIEFDQMIQEFDAWVHISYKRTGKQRKSKLYAYHTADGKVVYSSTPPKSFGNI